MFFIQFEGDHTIRAKSIAESIHQHNRTVTEIASCSCCGFICYDLCAAVLTVIFPESCLLRRCVTGIPLRHFFFCRRAPAERALHGFRSRNIFQGVAACRTFECPYLTQSASPPPHFSTMISSLPFACNRLEKRMHPCPDTSVWWSPDHNITAHCFCKYLFRFFSAPGGRYF